MLVVRDLRAVRASRPVHVLCLVHVVRVMSAVCPALPVKAVRPCRLLLVRSVSSARVGGVNVARVSMQRWDVIVGVWSSVVLPGKLNLEDYRTFLGVHTSREGDPLASQDCRRCFFFKNGLCSRRSCCFWNRCFFLARKSKRSAASICNLRTSRTKQLERHHCTCCR